MASTRPHKEIYISEVNDVLVQLTFGMMKSNKFFEIGPAIACAIGQESEAQAGLLLEDIRNAAARPSGGVKHVGAYVLPDDMRDASIH